MAWGSADGPSGQAPPTLPCGLPAARLCPVPGDSTAWDQLALVN